MGDANSSGQYGAARGPWMTPARARELAATAADLYRQLHEADLARDADPDPARRRAGWRLDVAAGGLQSAAEELLDTADELIRLAARRADACPMPWGACPEHGATLRSTGGRCWRTTPGCLRRWQHNRLGEPCAEPVTHRVVDADGEGIDLCDGHAADARVHLIGARVIPLS
ncbi:hypothetical protein [Geodermatophilus obscurus]|uniref:Uncharacterized protein n=1 Tax=Geodermatophilus obscurus (strain ATCC 25078 / DSM 43160 / JCM 3152 / CCUG 61914 / KCC A-0152 / KCTC 9177 / NBRC 13315 / NRRL B-3577 / G-20) TaxID=526225 RepID=D2S8A9_GEOOG|nr:hypothetical protein [Geodermatophilus obscurus]ADB73531.1 hypothetical protein Gobs_0767 [Geodermatophilus obscurus DSM 43160]